MPPKNKSPQTPDLKANGPLKDNKTTKKKHTHTQTHTQSHTYTNTHTHTHTHSHIL